MPRIGDRIAALERLRGRGITVIRIEGGLPADIGGHNATVGGEVRLCGDAEPFAEFQDRVVAVAQAAREAFVVLGGLPEPGTYQGQMR